MLCEYEILKSSVLAFLILIYKDNFETTLPYDYAFSSMEFMREDTQIQ